MNLGAEGIGGFEEGLETLPQNGASCGFAAPIQESVLPNFIDSALGIWRKGTNGARGADQQRPNIKNVTLLSDSAASQSFR